MRRGTSGRASTPQAARRGAPRLVVVIGAALLLAACEREMHDMYRQPRYDTDEPSPLFPDGRATRPPPPGSVPVATGILAMTTSGRRGEEVRAAELAALAASSAGTPTIAQLARGRERYEIVCMPCHSALGDGDGTVVRRGFPRPPSYHEERLRRAGDRHFFDVITNGYGVMYSYADRVAPADRWAIVAYIRALQLSQHAELAQLPADVQAQLAPALRLPSAGGAAAASAAVASPNAVVRTSVAASAQSR